MFTLTFKEILRVHERDAPAESSLQSLPLNLATLYPAEVPRIPALQGHVGSPLPSPRGPLGGSLLRQPHLLPPCVEQTEGKTHSVLPIPGPPLLSAVPRAEVPSQPEASTFRSLRSRSGASHCVLRTCGDSHLAF